MRQYQSRIRRLASILKPGVSIQATSVPAGDIDNTMALIIEEVQTGMRLPEIRAIVGDVLGQKVAGAWVVQERDWRGEIDALYRYVRENVRYTRDTYMLELLQRPDRTLQLRIGDCDDLTILLASLYMSIGYAVMLRIIGLGGNTYQHIYLVVGIPPEEPEDWIPVDPSRDEGPGWEVTENVTLSTDYLIEPEEV